MKSELWWFFLLQVACLSPIAAFCWWVCKNISDKSLRIIARCIVVLALIIPVPAGSEGVALFSLMAIPVLLVVVVARGVINDTSLTHWLLGALAVAVFLLLLRTRTKIESEELFKKICKYLIVLFLIAGLIIFGTLKLLLSH